MEELRQSLQDLNFTYVSTYIQSGNVIFESVQTDTLVLEQEIERKLANTFDFDVPTFIRTDKELLDIAKQSPFDGIVADKMNTIYISFTKSVPDPSISSQVINLSIKTDQFELYKNNIFWLYRREYGKSTLTNKKLGKVLQAPTTRRNMNTIHRIIKKYFTS